MSYPQLLPWTIQEIAYSHFSKLNNLYLVRDVVHSLLHASTEGTMPFLDIFLATGFAGHDAVFDAC